jgi:hypothetical protein
MYCGASLDGAAPNFDTCITADGSTIGIVGGEQIRIEPTDLSGVDRQAISDAMRKGENHTVIDSKTQILQDHPARQETERPSKSFEEVLTLLGKMKIAYDQGQMNYGIYKRFVTDSIMDYVSSLDENIKINFIVNDIKNSDLKDYIDDDLHKELITSVLSSQSADKTG